MKPTVHSDPGRTLFFDLCGNEDNHSDCGTLLGSKSQKGTKGVESQGGGQEQISLC